MQTMSSPRLLYWWRCYDNISKDCKTSTLIVDWSLLKLEGEMVSSDRQVAKQELQTTSLVN